MAAWRYLTVLSKALQCAYPHVNDINSENMHRESSVAGRIQRPK